MRKFVFIAMLLPAFASGAVYKCVDSEGRVTFSDRACAGAIKDAEVIDLKPANSGGLLGLPEDYKSRELEAVEQRRRSAAESAAQRRDEQLAMKPCKKFSDTQIRTMTIRNQVVPGMSTSDARKAWGSPSRINGHQYVYRWGSSEASYFYVENGCVRSVDGGYRGPRAVR